MEAVKQKLRAEAERKASASCGATDRDGGRQAVRVRAAVTPRPS